MDRSTMAWGLEARVPFLDKAFLEVAMNVEGAEVETLTGRPFLSLVHGSYSLGTLVA